MSAAAHRAKISTNVAARRPAAQPTRATTVRLDPAVRGGLALLQPLLKKPFNKIVNDALLSYIDRRTAELEGDTEDLLRALQNYRRRDPGFKRAIRAFIDAEVTHRDRDPVDGRVTPPSAGSVLRRVRDLIRE